MVSALPATAVIFMSAVTPTTIATRATTATDVAIFTRTDLSANQRDRRGTAGEGDVVLTEDRPGCVLLHWVWRQRKCDDSRNSAGLSGPMDTEIVMHKSGHRSAYGHLSTMHSHAFARSLKKGPAQPTTTPGAARGRSG